MYRKVTDFFIPPTWLKKNPKTKNPWKIQIDSNTEQSLNYITDFFQTKGFMLLSLLFISAISQDRKHLLKIFFQKEKYVKVTPRVHCLLQKK